MLAGTNYDGYFLEIRFRPRRRLRAAAVPAQGQQDRVVGVITSKFGELENKEDIKRRLKRSREIRAA